MKIVLVLISLISLQTLAAEKKKLVTVIGSNMAAPFLLDAPNKESNPQGLTTDYLKELANILGESFEIRVLPKFRIREQFEKDEIDLNCYTTKEWAGEGNDKFKWSVPLFVIIDQLASSNGPVKSIQDLHGATVGTVLRYRYPGIFEDSIKKGDIFRDEVKSEEALLNMLSKKRINYGVIGHVQLRYYLKNHPNSKIHSSALVLSENVIRCWVRKGSTLSVERLNAAIEQMKNSGRLEEIFSRYR
ncbi:substrate-binding periplasmic protein [Bdellovibrio svalbardensis]|uniref:Transporter substrate-binding domain-containing protein n=1 Tax=Bdellovibrio svalbardensis TaxID=2972972 RepID=A0ABT6DG48_9BACT|nr:transporter substrate-binding domain-containing protein [Bdellovibrio svalbardensis]MDG0815802.1 transporter substrate-binding domain-containing protein [Bdellovibrio svalbardensis]